MIYSSVTNVRCVPVRRAAISFRFGAALAVGFCGVRAVRAPRRIRGNSHWNACSRRRICPAPRCAASRSRPTASSSPTCKGTRGRQGSLRSLGLRRQRRAPPPAGGFAHAGGRGSRAVGRGRGAPRTAAHFGVLGDRRIQLRARRPPPADSAERRPVRLRPGAQRRRRGAPPDDHGRVRNRRALLAALALRELHPRPESVRHRSGQWHRTRHHARGRRPGELRHGRVHRAGGNGSRHRLLVVAGRAPHRAGARR